MARDSRSHLAGLVGSVGKYSLFPAPYAGIERWRARDQRVHIRELSIRVDQIRDCWSLTFTTSPFVVRKPVSSASAVLWVSTPKLLTLQAL